MFEELVEEILLFFPTIKPPVKPDAIAYGLGLKILFLPLPYDNVSGLLNLESKSIIINKNHPYVRQRFSIAHELGHFFLHHKSSFLIGKEDSYSEREANIFAGTLLLPYFLLKNYLYLPTYKIARIFEVSQETLKIRLELLKKERKL